MPYLRIIQPLRNAWRGEGGSGFCYEVLWKLWGEGGVSSDTVM